ncbi:MAG: CPBP family intramembrane glutamic endopeptidase [Dehalococcoidia bacterium]
MKLPAALASPVDSGVSAKPWGIPAIALGLALPLLLWGSSLAIAIAEGTPEDLSSGEIIVGLIFTIILLDGLFIALPAAVCLWRYRLTWRALGFRSFSPGLWWLPISVAGVGHLGIIAYGLILIAFGVDPPEQDIEGLFDSRAVLPMVGLATVIMAPLAEELFFRGFVFPGLIRPLGVTGAMLASGLLFGMFHVTNVETLGLVLPFGLIGMLFAWLYYRTGSLWPSIAAHLIFNAVSFTILASTAGTIAL